MAPLIIEQLLPKPKFLVLIDSIPYLGTALKATQMAQIIKNMQLMEQPWNCPHGRPTLRHLINLEFLRRISDDSQKIN